VFAAGVVHIHYSASIVKDIPPALVAWEIRYWITLLVTLCIITDPLHLSLAAVFGVLTAGICLRSYLFILTDCTLHNALAQLHQQLHATPYQRRITKDGKH
jgi:hypothetical protein